MKYVIGWLKLKPGKRDEFLTLMRPFTEKTRQEEGVDFFECHPSSTESDTVLVVERYRTAEDHDLHHQTAHFADIWGHVQRLCVEGRFENIFADRVDIDTARFAE